MTATAVPARFFRFRFQDARPARFDECSICGATGRVLLVEHDAAVHEVFALATWGAHSVTYPAREHVLGWADGTVPLPTREEWRALQEAFYARPEADAVVHAYQVADRLHRRAR